MTAIFPPKNLPEASERRGPVGNAQRMIWTGHQLHPESPTFNTAWRFDFRTAIDPQKFNAAFEKLVQGADVLRLVIRSGRKGEPLLVDTGVPAGRFEEVLAGSGEEATAWIERAIQQPFDIERESFHSALIRVQDDHWIWYLNQHHAIVDASSGSILFSALSNSYKTGDDVVLPSFFDHAVTEEARVNIKNKDHWEAAARPVNLPKFFGAQPSGNRSKAAMRKVSLSQGQMDGLNALILSDGFKSLSRDMALYQIYLTLLTAWMNRITDEDQTQLGVVTHGRTSPASRLTPGCFIELFPMTVDTSGAQTFRDLHQTASTSSFDLFRRATPGTSSIAGLGSFNTVLNVITTRFEDFAGTTPEIEWLDNGNIDPHHAFRLNVMELSESAGITFAFAFNAEVFDTDRQDRTIAQFMRLLDALLSDADAEISTIALADADDASVKLTKTRFDQTPATDVLHAYDAAVRNDPEVPVIFEGGDRLSRAALDQRANSFVATLQARGVSPGDRVGLHLPRSSNLVAAMLGCLKLGATFVPLDPSQSAERLSSIETEAKLRLTITDPTLSALWQPVGAAVVTSDLLTASAEQETPQTDHPAYMIFTSGTTGRPKGVVIERASLSRYAAWANRHFAGDLPSCWPLFSAIGFDLTITSIFAPLVSEGSIRIYPDASEGSATTVLDVFEDDAVDVVKLTPAHLRLVLASRNAPVKRIKSLVLGGEDLTTELSKNALSALGRDIAIFNEYGPTEATVGCMIHRFDPQRDVDVSVPIGRPAEETGIYVLDAGLNPVPDEVAGDLYITGTDRLATGYFERRGETDAKFVDNPIAGGKMYQSGDLASVRRDGTILYHGRADQQIKVSGVRIETGEILAAAQAVPGVDDCVVTLFDPVEASKQLCRTCGIPKAQPGTQFVERDQCSTCADFDSFKASVDGYFGELDQLRQIVGDRAPQKSGKYDCLMLLSGGKDSTYALSKLMEITDNVLTATLDNGFISDGAKENIRIITERLGVEHRWLKTPAMNEIFVDSLKRNANVCQGCFKTIYTLGLHLAKDEGIPTIVTGLSRGQLFETRLAPELFAGKQASPDEIDQMVLEARRSYHGVPDVAAQKLNCGLFDDGKVLDEVAIVDFYRYADVPLSEMYSHLQDKVGWSRPMDTGRSTNCLINDAGIYFHQKRRAYHNYALPYSWDVRLGHKTRAEAIDELDDDIDSARVQKIMDEIGFDEPIEDGFESSKAELVLYYKSQSGVAPADIRAALLRSLPREAVPKTMIAVENIPLTPNGKTNFDAMPSPDLWRAPVATSSAPVDDSRLSETERTILKIWRGVLGLPGLGAQDNFYDAGGDSLAAIKIATQASAIDLPVRPQEIFKHQTVAEVVSNLPQQADAKPDAPERRASRRQLSSRNSAQLAALFGSKKNG